MFIRLALAVSLLSFMAGCFNGMRVDIATPECTVNEKSPECTSQPKEPLPMSEDGFFDGSV